MCLVLLSFRLYLTLIFDDMETGGGGDFFVSWLTIDIISVHALIGLLLEIEIFGRGWMCRRRAREGEGGRGEREGIQFSPTMPVMEL